jgi:hypothetical protein
MKTYLLLRNNRRSGPHSLGEIMQMGLTCSDLIWEEGVSVCWKHPFELDAFRHVPPPGATTALPPTPVHVRFPVWRHADEACPVPTLAVHGVWIPMDIALSGGGQDSSRMDDMAMPTPEEPMLAAPMGPASSAVAALGGSRDTLQRQASAAVADRRSGASGKVIRRSRRKYPHDVDLSLLLSAAPSRSRSDVIGQIVENGFRIIFTP